MRTVISIFQIDCDWKSLFKFLIHLQSSSMRDSPSLWVIAVLVIGAFQLSVSWAVFVVVQKSVFPAKTTWHVPYNSLFLRQHWNVCLKCYIACPLQYCKVKWSDLQLMQTNLSSLPLACCTLCENLVYYLSLNFNFFFFSYFLEVPEILIYFLQLMWLTSKLTGQDF